MCYKVTYVMILHTAHKIAKLKYSKNKNYQQKRGEDVLKGIFVVLVVLGLLININYVSSMTGLYDGGECNTDRVYNLNGNGLWDCPDGGALCCSIDDYPICTNLRSDLDDAACYKTIFVLEDDMSPGYFSENYLDCSNEGGVVGNCISIAGDLDDPQEMAEIYKVNVECSDDDNNVVIQTREVLYDETDDEVTFEGYGDEYVYDCEDISQDISQFVSQHGAPYSFYFPPDFPPESQNEIPLCQTDDYVNNPCDKCGIYSVIGQEVNKLSQPSCIGHKTGETRVCGYDNNGIQTYLGGGEWSECEEDDVTAMIFVTSESYQGNLFNDYGSYNREGANQICQGLANNAGLFGEWHALLSSVEFGSLISFEEKLDSLFPEDIEYYNLNYELVAEGKAQLLGNWLGNLGAPISYDENGQLVEDSSVWTGGEEEVDCSALIHPQGLESLWWLNFDSLDFGASIGSVGEVGSLTTEWYESDSISCDSYARLYCASGQYLGCTPGDTQTTNCETGIDNCPVGTKTRTCDNGVWSNFGSCFTDLDDCNGCIEEQDLCTDEIDGCCGDLICYGGLGKLCIECREEGESCFQDSDCCDRPCDGNGGTVCGCPDGFEWGPFAQKCVARFSNCGENPPGTQRCNSLLDILINPLLCLFSQNDEPPYEEVCCPYIEYQGEQYYQRQDIEVY